MVGLTYDIFIGIYVASMCVVGMFAYSHCVLQLGAVINACSNGVVHLLMYAHY